MNKDNYVDLYSCAAYVGKREKIKPVDEYINRETVIKGFTDLLQKPGDIYPTDITTMMQRVPAADVREVVYCRDCRHRDPEDHKCDCGEFERAGCVFPVDDDYFCAYGERPNCGVDMRGEDDV